VSTRFEQNGHLSVSSRFKNLETMLLSYSLVLIYYNVFMSNKIGKEKSQEKIIIRYYYAKGCYR